MQDRNKDENEIGIHILKFERRIPMGSSATKPSCGPKEFWTGCQENFPRGSKLFQKFRDYTREREREREKERRSTVNVATKIARLSRLVLSRNAHFMSHLKHFIILCSTMS